MAPEVGEVAGDVAVRITASDDASRAVVQDMVIVARRVSLGDDAA